MATKRTSEIIPLCHLLNLTKSGVEFTLLPEQNAILARCTVSCDGKTGVEMEALTGVSAALLTVYDMCKAVDKRMVLSDIHLIEKHGGKAGISALRTRHERPVRNAALITYVFPSPTGATCAAATVCRRG